MRRIQAMSRGGWIVVGVVLAAILFPLGAYATGITFTGIQDASNANKANVTGAGQLQTAEAGPSNFITIEAVHLNKLNLDSTFGPCRRVYGVPTGRSLILRGIAAQGFGAFQIVIYAETAAQVTSHGPCDSAQPAAAPTDVVESWLLNNNIPVSASTTFVVPAGSTIYAHVEETTSNSVANYGADLNLSGYLVPSAAAPTQTPVFRTVSP